VRRACHRRAWDLFDGDGVALYGQRSAVASGIDRLRGTHARQGAIRPSASKSIQDEQLTQRLTQQSAKCAAPRSRPSGGGVAALCALLAGALLATAAPGAADEPPPTPEATAPDNTKVSGVVEWAEHFALVPPVGWQVRDETFSTESTASPDGVGSRAVLMTSPAQTHVLAIFFDGSAIKLGLAEYTQSELVVAYVDAFHLSRGAPVARTEPWTCDLDVPEGTAQFGLRAWLRVDEPEGGSASDPAEGGPVWVCAARSVRHGAMVITMGWAGDGSELSRDETVSEIERALTGIGLAIDGHTVGDGER